MVVSVRGSVGVWAGVRVNVECGCVGVGAPWFGAYLVCGCGWACRPVWGVGAWVRVYRGACGCGRVVVGMYGRLYGCVGVGGRAGVWMLLCVFFDIGIIVILLFVSSFSLNM